MLITDMQPTEQNAARHQITLYGVLYEAVAWQVYGHTDKRSWDVYKLDGKMRLPFIYIIQSKHSANAFDVHPWHHYIPEIGKSFDGNLEGIIAMMLNHLDKLDEEFAEIVGTDRGFAALRWAIENAPLKHGFRRSHGKEAFTIPIYDAAPRQLVRLRFETEARTVRVYDGKQDRYVKERLDFGPEGKYTVECKNPEYGDQDVRVFDDPREAVLSAIEASNSAYT